MIALGGVKDHAGRLEVQRIPNFDLDRTIFQTLEGRAARYIMALRVGKDLNWTAPESDNVEARYAQAVAELVLEDVPAELLEFLVNECDFDVEHADGSFLDHLYFCYEYSALHYPEQSPLVMLLHSILGTGTNTFAMTADKIPALRALLSDHDWRHTEAFPSMLRMLYAGELREELRQNLHRWDRLQSIRFHRVIDNEAIEMSGDDLWVALNYQLIHLVDFIPAANWQTHANDTSFVLFRDLYDLLEAGGKKVAGVTYAKESAAPGTQGERLGLGGWLASRLPISLVERLASKSVRRFSEQCGHSLEYTITWAE